MNFIHSAGGESGTSNMAVMEVNLPSGFTANMDALPALRKHRGVRRVDTEKGDTKVVIQLLVNYISSQYLITIY